LKGEGDFRVIVVAVVSNFIHHAKAKRFQAFTVKVEGEPFQCRLGRIQGYDFDIILEPFTERAELGAAGGIFSPDEPEITVHAFSWALTFPGAGAEIQQIISLPVKKRAKRTQDRVERDGK
jgi:hypothetical protein